MGLTLMFIAGILADGHFFFSAACLACVSIILLVAADDLSNS